jgi:hypothetical protein
MGKADVIASLKIINNNFLTGYVTWALLRLPACHDLLDLVVPEFPGIGRVPGDQIAEALREPEKRVHLRRELIKWLHRSYYRDAYQVVREYCEDTNQLPTLRSQSWYQFARLMRDCLSHNFRLDLGDYVNRGLLPIEWECQASGKKVTITQDMDGTALRFEQFFLTEAWELVQQMKGFVEQDLL